MSPALDDLLAAWRTEPKAATAVSLCSALADLGERGGTITGPQRAIVIEIGRDAGIRFSADAEVLIAIGRMYLGAGELVSDAQAVLVRAARLAPKEPRAFRLLGEALVRRGDAVHAARALARAVEGGMNDASTLIWRDRARLYAPIQEARGERAVIEELGRALARKTEPVATKAAAGSSPGSAPRADVAAVGARGSRRARTETLKGMPSAPDPPETRGSKDSIPDPDEVVTRFRPGERLPAAAFRSSPDLPAPSAPAVAPEDEPTTKVTSMQQIIAPVPRARMDPQTARRGRDSDPATVRREWNPDLATMLRPTPLPPPPSDPAPVPEIDTDDSDDPATIQEVDVNVDESSSDLLERLFRPELVSLTADSDVISAERVAEIRSAATRLDVAPAARPFGPPMAVTERAGELIRSELLEKAPRSAPAPPSSPSARPEEVSVAPPRRRSRRALWWIAALLVLGGAAGGGWFLRERQRAADLQTASSLQARVQEQLRTGGAKGFAEAGASIRRARELDPGSRQVASAEVRLFTLRTLDEGAAAAADLGRAMARARSLGVADASLAAGGVVEALSKNDTQRAVDLIAGYDAGSPSPDGLFEVAAGAALEARGDAGAVARYRRAASADPGLIAARIRLARALLLAGDLAGARPEVAAVAAGAQGRAEPPVLAALAKAVDPARTEAVVAPIEPTAIADLPRSLRSIAWALIVPARGESRDAGAGLSAAIDDADSPGALVFCGARALEAGDGEAAVQAITRALSMAPRFAPALSLQAKLSLQAGRLDDAKRDLEALEPAVRAEVSAVLAYEAGDLAALAAPAPGEPAALQAWREALRDRALGARPIEAARRAALAKAPWGDVLAADAALDEGDLDKAREIVKAWPDAAAHPARALRLARLERYEGNLDEARAALAQAAPTRPALIERALLDAEVRELREKSAASLDEKLEPERRWLAAYLRARQGPAAARLAAARLKLPLPDAPRSVRLAAALALGELQDKARGDALTKALLAAFPKNLDVVRAAVGLRLLPPKALPQRKKKAK